MRKMLSGSAIAALALAVAIPAFAGGSHCSGSAGASASAMTSCSGERSAAWAGAWLQRAPSGQVTVAQVVKGSPAARSGLKPGDVVVAVNGYDLASSTSSEDRQMCASHCSVGSTCSYTVHRGRATKVVKFKLEKMPANTSARLDNREASFDPAFAAMVIPAIN